MTDGPVTGPAGAPGSVPPPPAGSGGPPATPSGLAPAPPAPGPERLTRQQALGVLAAVLLALFVRCFLVVVLAGHPFFSEPVGDAEYYDRWARQIAAGDVVGSQTFLLDPLYPYFLGLVYRVFGRELATARLLQAALGVFGSLLLFGAGRRLAGFRTGLVALVLAAVTQTLAFHDVAPLKEGLAVVAEDAALCFLVAARGRGGLQGLGGFALGIGSLARGNFRLLLPAAAACTGSWRGAGCVLAGGFLALLPAMARNAFVEDFALSTSQTGQTLYIGNNPENPTGRYVRPAFVPVSLIEQEESGFRAEAERRLGRPLRRAEVDAYWRNEALHYIVDHPAAFLERLGKRFLLLANRRDVEDEYDVHYFAEFTPLLGLLLPVGVLFPCAGLGVWLAGRRHPLLTVLLVTYALSLLPFFIFARYRLPLLPPVFLFAAIAVCEAPRLVRTGSRGQVAGAVAVLAGCALVVNAPIEKLWDLGSFETSNSHANVGLLYLRRGDPEAALSELETAFALQPRIVTKPTLAHAAALACIQLKDLARAEGYLQRAVEVDALDYRPCLDLGQLYLLRGEPARAVEACRLAVARAPGESAPYARLARAYAALRRPEEALRVWDEAIGRFPRLVPFRVARMRLLAETGRGEEAAAAAREVLRLDPANAEARRLVEAAPGK